MISAVIPVYNDQEVLHELINRLKPALQKISSRFEIIFIDDGSADRSWPIIEELCAAHPEITGIKLARNFGQQGAIKAGLDHSHGDYIVIMDSDLQDRPEDIHKLIESLESNHSSMAIAQWESREDSFFKRLVSWMFYEFSFRFTTIRTEPRLGIFRVIRKSVVDELKKFPEKSATPISLLYFIGCDYSVVPLQRDARAAGSSGYNLRKMLSLTMARLFSFSMFPIRLATYSGLVISFLSFVAIVFLVVQGLTGETYPGWTSVMVVILFLFGLNFAFLGIIGEYLGKIFIETKQRPAYVVSTVKKSSDVEEAK
jgi:glycosyltransferase involved in cell wall biosynthesis